MDVSDAVRSGSGATPEGLGLRDDLSLLRRRIDALQADGSGTLEHLADLQTAHEELRVAEEEVRAQQDELRRLVAARRAGRWQHERLISLLPQPIVVTDAQGSVSAANVAAAHVLGVKLDRLLRKPLQSFVHPVSRPALRTMLNRTGEVKHARTEVVLTPRGSDALPAELVATVSDDLPEGADITWLITQRDADDAEVLSDVPLVTALMQLTELRLHEDDIVQILGRAARICAAALGAEFSVSLISGDPDRPEAVGTSSRAAQQGDGAQIVVGDGPCRRACAQASAVVVENLADDPQWERLSHLLADVPVRSVLSLPVIVGDESIGAFNVYAEQAGPPARMHERAATLGTAVTAILHELRQKQELENTAHHLQRAMETRPTIDMAVGIVMAARGCSSDDAFTFMVQRSMHENRKLRQIAQQIVDDVAADRPR